MESKNAEILSKELVDFVLDKSYLVNCKVTPSTSVVDDLGMDGDDGIEFIIAYGKRFNVDLSHFMADKYFEAEGLQFITGIFKKVGFKKSGLSSLTLKRLQDGINEGKLV